MRDDDSVLNAAVDKLVWVLDRRDESVDISQREALAILNALGLDEQGEPQGEPPAEESQCP